MTVLDISNNDLSTLDAACLKANGVTGVICGVFDRDDPPNRMRRAAAQCLNAGIDILGFYALCYFGSPYGVKRDTKWACQLAREFGVNRVWIDVETDGIANGFTDGVAPTPQQRIAELRTCVQMVRSAGLEPGIYTGRWFWVPQMANTTEFASLPLWHSEYPSDGHEVRSVDYGGWTNVAIHQYTSSLPLCGRSNRDANYVFEEDDMGMTPEEKARFDRLLKWTVGSDARMDEMEKLGLLGMEARLTRDESNDGPIGQRLSVLEEQRAAETQFTGNELADGDLVRLQRVKEGQP